MNDLALERERAYAAERSRSQAEQAETSLRCSGSR